MTSGGAERAAWGAGAIGLLGTLIGWIIAPTQFPHAWLAALTLWIGWPLGSIALLLIHALAGGRWGAALRPPLVAGVLTLPLLLPAALPLLFVLHALYPWMHADIASGLSNRFYLNAPFFFGRGIVYLIAWLGLGALTVRALRQDDPDAALRRIAPPGLILLALTITFAAIDFTLSMEPRFKSSVFGMLVETEATLFALSIAVLFATVAPAAAERRAMGDLGRLMLGLLVLWGYLDFMQILIIWQSDLVHEAAWYARRTSGGWGAVAAVIAALHFALPFFVLLWPQMQRSARAMRALAALLVAIEIPRAWWIVLPDAGRGWSLLDAAAMLALVGLGAAVALRAPRLVPGVMPGAAVEAGHG